MNRTHLEPAPWCTILAVAAAMTAAAPAWAITWGEVDAANRYAYVGAVVTLPVPGSGAVPRVYCSGTLIHPRVMLTAAHCTRSIESWLAQGVPMWAFQVSFAPYALDENTWLEVEHVITHPEYNEYDGPGGTANPREVGVIILKKPVKKIEPAALPEPGLLDFLKDVGALRDGPEGGTPLTVTGYGSTLEFPPPEMVPPDGGRRFVEGEFRALNNAWIITSRNQATDDGGGAAGDSGCPVLWTDPGTGKEIVVGIHCWGDAERVATSFEYRADISDTLDFIEVVIAAVAATPIKSCDECEPYGW